MKIGLVQPKYRSVWEALALGYMGSYLDQHLPELEFYFGQGFFDPREDIIRKCAECDIVGVSATTPVFPEATRIAREIKLLNPNVKTVLGGYMATAMPNWCAEYSEWDYVVVGEGEWAMLSIAKGEIKSRIVHSQNISPLDDIPCPDRKLIRNERTIQLTEKNDGERITAILSQRGCPYSCNFCADGSGLLQETNDSQLGFLRTGHSMWGMKMRYHSIERVYSEMKQTIEDWNLDLLKFCDMTTNSDKRRLKDLCRLIINNGGFGHCQIGSNLHAAPVDEELCQLLAKAGWREVWIGVEAATDRLLATLGKRITVKQVVDAFRWAHEAGLKTRAYFQIGHWHETEEDIQAIPELVKEIRPEIFGTTITCPYPGTQVFLELTVEERKRMLQWDFLEELDEYGNPIRHTPRFTNEQLVGWQRWLCEQIPQETQLSWRTKEIVGRQKNLLYMEK